VTVEELRRHYHQIVYAVGMRMTARLGIPCEGYHALHAGVMFHRLVQRASRLSRGEVRFVGVARRGGGQPATSLFDSARMLLPHPRRNSKKPTLPHTRLEALRHSQVREVYILGRRGPEQASFTPTELKEFGEMEDVDPIVSPEDLAGCVIPENAGNAPQWKNLKILQSFAERQPGDESEKLHLRFLVSTDRN